ncbi:hypothetical protein, partial [Pseudomonas fluorescens]|uniref:hypothetical protein n=1 Tax=Pseudomonas fluorescens TaxID=294 RepID=UPI001A92A289
VRAEPIEAVTAEMDMYTDKPLSQANQLPQLTFAAGDIGVRIDAPANQGFHVVPTFVKDYYAAQCTNWLLILLKSRLCPLTFESCRHEKSIARRWRL